MLPVVSREDRLRAGDEPHDHARLPHEGAIGGVDRDTPSRRDHAPLGLRGIGQRLALELSERGFAIHLENLGDLPSRLLHDHLISIKEPPAKLLRDQATDVRLARAGEPRQVDTAPPPGRRLLTGAQLALSGRPNSW